VAGGQLGSGLMMESNYPFLLSRIVEGKSQYAPEPEVYMVLGVKRWLASLVVTLLDCPLGFAVGREGVRWRCRPACSRVDVQKVAPLAPPRHATCQFGDQCHVASMRLCRSKHVAQIRFRHEFLPSLCMGFSGSGTMAII
jgi:hypothetical protein